MKIRTLLVGATVAGAFTVGSVAPAFAEDVETAAGVLTVDIGPGGGEITADGAESNPDPADGYITAYGDPSGTGDICADDNGSPGNSTDPTCVSDNV